MKRSSLVCVILLLVIIFLLVAWLYLVFSSNKADHFTTEQVVANTVNEQDEDDQSGYALDLSGLEIPEVNSTNIIDIVKNPTNYPALK